MPKLTPTTQNQILIHPEHAQGTLQVPIVKEQKTKSFVGIFSAVAIFVLISILALGYFYIPKTRTVIYANSAIEDVSVVNSKSDSVNQALDSLYKHLTGSSASADTSLSEIKADVLSANTSAATNSLSANSFLLATEAEKIISEKGKVKGFSIPEADPNKIVREQRKLAESVETRSKETQNLLDSKIAIHENKDNPPSAEELQKQLKEVLAKTSLYASETEKTSLYYIEISDASIDLYNISSSLSTLKDVDNAIADLTKIKNRFAQYQKEDLPVGMEELNNDVVAVFDVLIGFFQVANTNDPNKLAAALNDFLSDTASLSNKTYSDELSFWQNNKVLSSYEALNSDFEKVKKTAEDVKENNNFFLLGALGVK